MWAIVEQWYCGSWLLANLELCHGMGKEQWHH
jgi:hypothetical protein